MNAKTEVPVEDLDLDAYSDAQSGRVYLKNPHTGAPSQAYVEFAGPEHPERRKRIMDHQRRMRAHLQKTGKLKLQDPAEDDEDQLDMLVACAISWNVRAGGKPVEFSKENVRKWLSDPQRRWFRDQCQAGFEERENFIARSDAS